MKLVMTFIGTKAAALPPAIFWPGSFRPTSDLDRAVFAGQSASSRGGHRDAALTPDFMSDKLAAVSFVDAIDTILRMNEGGNRLNALCPPHDLGALEALTEGLDCSPRGTPKAPHPSP